MQIIGLIYLMEIPLLSKNNRKKGICRHDNNRQVSILHHDS
jgi:hypothetical protein